MEKPEYNAIYMIGIFILALFLGFVVLPALFINLVMLESALLFIVNALVIFVGITYIVTGLKRENTEIEAKFVFYIFLILSCLGSYLASLNMYLWFRDSPGGGYGGGGALVVLLANLFYFGSGLILGLSLCVIRKSPVLFIFLVVLPLIVYTCLGNYNPQERF